MACTVAVHLCVQPWLHPHYSPTKSKCVHYRLCFSMESWLHLCLLMIRLAGCPLCWCRLSLSLPLHPSCPHTAQWNTWDSTHRGPSCNISDQFTPLWSSVQCLSERKTCMLFVPLGELINNRCFSWHCFGSKSLNFIMRDSAVSCAVDFTPSALQFVYFWEVGC